MEEKHLKRNSRGNCLERKPEK